MKGIALLVLPLVVLSSCGIKRFYSGPPRPREEIARMRYSEQGAKIVDIDGASFRIALVERYGYELLPGPHTIEVSYYRAFRSGRQTCFIKFDAEAGKEYQVIGFSTRSWKWGAFLRKYTNGYSDYEYAQPFSKESDVLCRFPAD
jgi:hypothetical protein